MPLMYFAEHSPTCMFTGIVMHEVNDVLDGKTEVVFVLDLYQLLCHRRIF